MVALAGLDAQLARLGPVAGQEVDTAAAAGLGTTLLLCAWLYIFTVVGRWILAWAAGGREPREGSAGGGGLEGVGIEGGHDGSYAAQSKEFDVCWYGFVLTVCCEGVSAFVV